MQIRPFILVPRLIPQPTWGGNYIALHKNIASLFPKALTIGQSYELFPESLISFKNQTQYRPSIELCSQTNSKLISHRDQPVPLKKLIEFNPTKVLGKSITSQQNNLSLLIKFTQAKGNSYQLHPSLPNTRWTPKPESWFFLSSGLITLGIKPGTNLHQYKLTCHQIHSFAQTISSQIKSKQLSLSEGKQKLASFIQPRHPRKFVNLLQVAKHQAIDLSQGGLHHSWENNSHLNTLGNLVYELQLPVPDHLSTIRCFDQGKFGPKGQIRDLQIDDYFRYLNSDPSYNLPQNHFQQPKILKHTSTYTIKQILQSPYYCLKLIHTKTLIKNKYSHTTDRYHHLFVNSGKAKLITAKTQLILTCGFSAFIPASTGQYSIKPYRSRQIELLLATQ